MRNIYLCGFMGCGKSHIGKMLAERLGMSLTDLDSYIEKAENMSIPDIFRDKGEPFFRSLEAKYIGEMPENSIVATGGGAIINPFVAETAQNAGTVIFLDADFETCYGRIKGDTHRPLVVNNTKEQLKELFDKRRAIYLENSDFSVKADGKDTDITESIIEKLEQK